MSEAGVVHPRAPREGIQAGELELRHLSCNGNQNNKKVHYFLRGSSGAYFPR